MLAAFVCTSSWDFRAASGAMLAIRDDGPAIEDIEKGIAMVDFGRGESEGEPASTGKAQKGSAARKNENKQYGLTGDSGGSQIHLADFEEPIPEQPRPGVEFDKEREWDDEIKRGQARIEEIRRTRQEQLAKRKRQRRNDLLKYIFTAEWLSFSRSCGDKCKCCGRCGGIILCILIVLAVVVGVPIVITVFTGGAL